MALDIVYSPEEKEKLFAKRAAKAVQAESRDAAAAPPPAHLTGRTR
mgnify:CR=1 FL=1